MAHSPSRRSRSGRWWRPGQATLRLGAVLLCVAGGVAAEEPRSFSYLAPPELSESGFLDHVLPRFALRSGRRGEPAAQPEKADLWIGRAEPGAVVFMARGDELRYAYRLQSDNAAARMFTDWLTAEPGHNTIAAFTPETGAGFTPVEAKEEMLEITFEGDIVLGEQLAAEHCGRCHVTAEGGRGGIGSTPSFQALRAMDDWAFRFMAFYALNPHPSFLRLHGVSPPFRHDRPPAIVPVELTLDEAEAIRAYAASLEPADLGEELQHQ
ncbi:hypothetical protein [Alkalilacustris brevis]|uniref:hypothetical protein n=1 Tax=Alkalilacustris brevis TaxID=2026338 RepID=UPI0012D31056|nr:hypothetical protein [Alkalilacustris brevis]